MSIKGLAHAELRVPDLGAAIAFHVDVLGLVEIARTPEAVYLGCGADGYYDVALVEGGTGVAHFAFQVEDEADLEYYAHRLAQQDVNVTEATDAEPGEAKAIRFALPSGHSIELVLLSSNPSQRYSYPHAAAPAFHRTRGISPLDVDHITLRSTDVETLARILSETLSFHLVDVRRSSDGAWRGSWLHVSDQHHDLAIIRGQPGETLDHLAWTVDSIDHMKRAADLLAQVGIPIEVGPGRHSIGGNLFMYFWAPGGNRYELSAEMAKVLNTSAEPRFWGDAPGLFSPWGIVPPESFSRGS